MRLDFGDAIHQQPHIKIAITGIVMKEKIMQRGNEFYVRNVYFLK